MAYSISIRKEAEADIVDAYEYYESCREFLGADFMLCVEESLTRITKNPNQYKVIYKNVHRALVKRFPYGVYYVVLKNKISVIAVIHDRRDPMDWQART